MALEPGLLVAGKFRLERLLGEGGIGLVYSATHLELDEPIALKFLRREMMQNADIVERFAQEARAAVKLKTEHVARVIDVGRHGDVPFMVMELLQGRDLQRVVTDDGPLPMDLAIELMIHACEALAEAHGRGIVHRDVKPENLFVLERDGLLSLKMLDFGISKVALSGRVSDIDLGARRTATIMGSPYYMSPEQIRATHEVDHRADLWSLGATLFEVLTGRTAFVGATFTELMFNIVDHRHQQLRTFRPDLPLELEEVVDRCLEKTRERRFQSAGELALALLPFTRSRARTVAERAVLLTRNSGLGAADLQMPPTLPPTASLAAIGIDSGSMPALRAPSVPRLTTQSEGRLLAHGATPVHASLEPFAAHRSAPRGRSGLYATLAALVVVLGVVLFFLGTKASSVAAAPPPESTSVASVTAAAPAPTPPAEPLPKAANEPAPSVSSVAVKHPPTAAGQKPPAPAKPTTRPSGNPDLEIRRER